MFFTDLSLIWFAFVDHLLWSGRILRAGPRAVNVPVNWDNWASVSRDSSSHAFVAPVWLVIFWTFYFGVIAGLWMLRRAGLLRPLDGVLRLLAFLHNIILSVWSAGMFLGAGRTVLAIARNRGGVSQTFCSSSFGEFPQNIYYWLYMFYLSKPVEFMDTFLLAARGKPLTLLHVWHHASVVLETWSWLRFGLTFSIYGMLFNAGIHAVMYLYFAYTSMQWRFPGKRMITLMQIMQFVASFVLTVPYLILLWKRPEGCMGLPGLAVSTFCNGSYLLLFVRFYRRTYKVRTKPKD
ncbi:hypothetical protein F1559_001988 [Cyanidiococcus yangmingshanensis]|uniref:Elongation of fatty acids protein n=1 Tax=Cyanidiococcus yangmingshanensis TaxID=2690220 RepID=A0A7J7IIQ9_9RHOD|nr:hypothetical protein F1559_001988 [Cyanidiococcus yangmingshanensis]